MKMFRKIKPILKTDWFIALILLGVFLATTGYKYAWDDQHVEIPLLKSLIDSQLYVGDYYVESLKRNFSSYFYRILAKFITTEQIPATYFILYLVSRYFLLFWAFKLWDFIAKNKYRAFLIVCTFIYMLRVHEFLYKTFSHQEFALSIIMAGIYFFFKERFILSALLLGLATNIHALYSMFPMTYLGFYLLFSIKKHGFKKLIFSSLIYLIAAAPFIFWVFRIYLISSSDKTVMPTERWLPLFLYACPQNFMLPMVKPAVLLGNLTEFLNATRDYLILIAFFLTNLFFNTYFKNNKKAIIFSVVAFGYLVLCFIFTYLYPNRLALNLNIVRNTQFLFFILGGFTTLLIIENVENKKPIFGLLLAAMFLLLKYYGQIATFASFLILFLLIILYYKDRKINDYLKYTIVTICGSVTILLIWGVIYSFKVIEYKPFILFNLIIAYVSMLIIYLASRRTKDKKKYEALKKILYLIPIVIFFYQYCYYHYTRVVYESADEGYWRMRSSWVDVQQYVKYKTPKDAIILVPYDVPMGGFRIFSERQIVVSERDCGIIGFDFNAAVEWQRRMQDVISFNITPKSSYKDALNKAVVKYKANYIVFMRYAVPHDHPIFKKLYKNQDFVLYQIMPFNRSVE